MISQIIIKIGEKKIELTLDEVRELKMDLDVILKEKIMESPFRGPIWEPFPQPSYPGNPNIFYGPYSWGGTGCNPNQHNSHSYTTNTKGERTI